jgi:hypothetical protein
VLNLIDFGEVDRDGSDAWICSRADDQSVVFVESDTFARVIFRHAWSSASRLLASPSWTCHRFPDRQSREDSYMTYDEFKSAWGCSTARVPLASAGARHAIVTILWAA